MAYVSVYKDVNYAGAFMRLGAGFFSNRDLVGHNYSGGIPSTTGVELDNAISSIRVPSNYIVSLHGSMSISASGGSRVLIGPRDIPDLNAITMDDTISSILVVPYKSYGGAYHQNTGVVISNGYNLQGRQVHLPYGDYDSIRLANEGLTINDQLRSLRVDANVIAILYSGTTFDEDKNAIVAVGPTVISSLETLGMLDNVLSIRVLFTDPQDYPPSAQPMSLGSSRSQLLAGPASYMSPSMRSADEINRRFDEYLLSDGGYKKKPDRVAAPAAAPAPAPVAATVAAPVAAPAKQDYNPLIVLLLVVLVVIMGIFTFSVSSKLVLARKLGAVVT